jgi:hypothetical protein
MFTPSFSSPWLSRLCRGSLRDLPLDLATASQSERVDRLDCLTRQATRLLLCLGSGLLLAGCGPSPIRIAVPDLRPTPLAPGPAEQNSPKCDPSLRLPQGLLCDAFVWSELPRSQTNLSLEVRLVLSDPSGVLLHALSGSQDWALVSAQLWMPSMGHGSSPTTVTRTGPHSWRVDRVFFLMPGPWEIRFKWQSPVPESTESAATYQITTWSGVVN